MTTDNPTVVVDDVWKIFRQGNSIVKALKGVSLEAFAGEFLVIRGSSGSGKSTLLNIIGGLDAPTKGQALVLSQRISSLSLNDRGAFRRRHIGIVFQDLSLIPHLTALENVALPISLETSGNPSAVRAASEVLAQCGLSDRLNHLPAELSYGERQRVAVARAAVRSPQLLLADEPTANLDDRNVDRIWSVINSLLGRGTTVIGATHDPRLERHANRVLQIEKGCIVQNCHGDQSVGTDRTT
jgi:putative ABC transport system ATP-binding protein